jgi:hypothetical protein
MGFWLIRSTRRKELKISSSKEKHLTIMLLLLDIQELRSYRGIQRAYLGQWQPSTFLFPLVSSPTFGICLHQPHPLCSWIVHPLLLSIEVLAVVTKISKVWLA